MEFNSLNKFRDVNFYSDDMLISKKSLIQFHLKLTYQKHLISDLDLKHKYWSQNIDY